MISSRYALWITFILMVALIPIVTHSYLNLKEDDGLSVKSIKAVLDDFESTPTNVLVPNTLVGAPAAAGL